MASFYMRERQFVKIKEQKRTYVSDYFLDLNTYLPICIDKYV